MDKVTTLRPVKQGDRTFFVCGCNPKEPFPFIAVALVQQAPLIVGMQCPNCSAHYDVVNGIVQKDPTPPKQQTRAEVIAQAEREIGNADLDDGA